MSIAGLQGEMGQRGPACASMARPKGKPGEQELTCINIMYRYCNL